MSFLYDCTYSKTIAVKKHDGGAGLRITCTPSAYNEERSLTVLGRPEVHRQCLLDEGL